MLACNTPLHGVLEAVVCGGCGLAASATIARVYAKEAFRRVLAKIRRS